LNSTSLNKILLDIVVLVLQLANVYLPNPLCESYSMKSGKTFTAENFLLLKEAGRGATGVTWIAQHRITGEIVAIKVHQLEALYRINKSSFVSEDSRV
jgi:hypothetical protein